MIDIDKARMEVYNTHTIWQDFRHWRRGVSQDISKHCNSLQKIRAKISVRYTLFDNVPTRLIGLYRNELLWLAGLEKPPATRLV